MAFLSAGEVEWLYSGVTNTKPSASDILADHFLVCSLEYLFCEGGIGSSKNGRLISARSRSSVSMSVRALAISVIQRAGWMLNRPGRVDPAIIFIFTILF